MLCDFERLLWGGWKGSVRNFDSAPAGISLEMSFAPFLSPKTGQLQPDGMSGGAGCGLAAVYVLTRAFGCFSWILARARSLERRRVGRGKVGQFCKYWLLFGDASLSESPLPDEKTSNWGTEVCAGRPSVSDRSPVVGISQRVFVLSMWRLPGGGDHLARGCTSQGAA